MDTTADKMLSVASVPEAQRMEQDIKDWAQYCCHVQTDVGTWLDTENACRKDGLHPAVHIQGVEREKEYVVGNHLQD